MSTELAAIEDALARDDLPTAAALATSALARGVHDPLVFNLAAWGHEEEGRFEAAEAIVRQALDRWPEDPTLHLALGVSLRNQGSLSAAVRAFERAIELDQGYGAAWFERGATFEKGGVHADAAADYRRALELEPNEAAPHAALAAGHARRGEREPATRHAQTAIQLDPTNLTAHTALALVALEEKRFADAVALLEPLTGKEEDRREQLIGIRTLLGDAYEGLKRYDDAYRLYRSAQALFESVHAWRAAEGAEDAIRFVTRIGDTLDAMEPAARSAPALAPAAPVATHVFLTGYPRSGTTLVENILASLPGAIAIEERPTLREAEQAYLREPDGLARLASLAEPDLAALRQGYWAKVTEAAGADLTASLFIDMDPFKGVRLPIIGTLFPGAKVVLMRRDPRDVVWSCFHTNFAFNAGTLAFTSLESTARHYAATQRIIARSLAIWPIDAFELRYERLVRDFDAITQELCTFLGVPWNDALRRFDRTAERRGVSTASTTQVRRGLYDGSGGWRRYASQLAAVEPILAPWIERLGYA